MPPKKQRKRIKTNMKQQKEIKSRLMEISIRFDKYIYKNKPIEVEEANILKAEITSYRNQCNNDVRILQVIEKLTRYIKNIIEHTVEKATVNTNLASEQDFISQETQESIDMFSEISVNNDNINIDRNNDHSEKSEELSHCILPTKIHQTINNKIKNNNTGNSSKRSIVKEISIVKDKTDNELTAPKPATAKKKRQKPKNNTINKENIKKTVKSRKKAASNNLLASNLSTERESSPSLLQNSLFYVEPNKKHSSVDVVSDVSLLTCNEHKTQNKTDTHEHLIAKQMDSLNINDDSESDISWIRSIKYVREINNDEFEQQLSLEESFWDDMTLPSHWKNINFFQ